MPEQAVTIVGAGLAGCEAAWQLLKRNIPVKMIEMRPEEKPAAFTSGDFAELVCSNSLRSNSLENAAGILKEEMRHLDSLIMQAAEQNQVPAGSALAVDRKGFSKTIRESLENHPLFTLETRRVDEIPQGPVIIATGPLTEGHLAKAIQSWSHQDDLHFFDAVAPVIQADSIDMDKAYFKSRYDKGEASYINCAMNQEQYDAFYEELIHARKAPVHGFDEEIDINVFEECMPVEEMAKRGKETLLFGPLKPVGLEREGEHPVAVVQLRQDDAAKSLYNIVGFQTRLAWPEQKRIFSMIPGLEQAEFERLGVMHRNTYINSPKLLNCFYQSKTNPDLFFAGQITGVEGYVESAASGLAAGINMARRVQGKEMVDFGRHTIIGSQAHYISSANPDHFEPMNANFGLLEPIRAGKKKRKALYGKRALETLDSLIETLDINETKSEHA